MWKFSVTALMTLFAWNSVLGGVSTLVLCFHVNGKTHIELAGETFHPNSEKCACAEKTTDVFDCTSCTDIVLEASDLGLMRPNELALVHLTTPIVSDACIPLTPVISPSISCTKSEQPARAPPEAESTSLMISRTIVLRL